LFAQNVKRRDIAPRLRPVLELYKDTRQHGESFGDFCHRIGVEALREATAAVPA
jgi:sulfite reductase (ferredoxin)